MVQEPGFEPGMTRPFKGRRYACSLLLHGAGGRIRTGRHSGLSTVAIPIRYASKSLVGRGRLELPCSGRLVLSEVCLPIPPPARVQGGPRTRKTAALNRRRLPIAPPGHLGARGRTRTYVAMKATGLRPVSFATHSRARVHTNCQRTWRRAGDSNPDVPRRRNLSRILGYQLPMLSAALRSRD